MIKHFVNERPGAVVVRPCSQINCDEEGYFNILARHIGPSLPMVVGAYNNCLELHPLGKADAGNINSSLRTGSLDFDC